MCKSGPPADGTDLHVRSIRAAGTILHVVFYPDRRLMVQCYKKLISGPLVDGSQRVKDDRIDSLHYAT